MDDLQIKPDTNHSLLAFLSANSRFANRRGSHMIPGASTPKFSCIVTAKVPNEVFVYKYCNSFVVVLVFVFMKKNGVRSSLAAFVPNRTKCFLVMGFPNNRLRIYPIFWPPMQLFRLIQKLVIPGLEAVFCNLGGDKRYSNCQYGDEYFHCLSPFYGFTKFSIDIRKQSPRHLRGPNQQSEAA